MKNTRICTDTIYLGATTHSLQFQKIRLSVLYHFLSIQRPCG
ncbi:hypothetical protein [Bacillus sp. FJAT-50079]|nr:hypothetical protein [Bacillus sp. FJAT-50079]